MSKVVRLIHKQSVLDQASAWLAKLERGLEVAEREELQRWLAQHPVHGENLMELALLWDDMSVLEELGALFPAPLLPAPPRPRFWQWSGHGALALGCAALLAITLTVFVGGWLDLATDAAPQLGATGVAYETAVGEHSKVYLPDGSIATLNTDSRIHVRYSDAQRIIVLERGEAYFEAAKNPQRPFQVSAGEKIVQAIGTAFNVDFSDTSGLEVLVTEGRIRLVTRSGGRLPVLFGDDTQVSYAGVGQRIGVAASNEISLSNISAEEMEKRLAWRDGMLVFERDALPAVLAEFGRYTQTRFVIADPGLNQVRVGGYFRSGDIEGLLIALEENFQILAHKDATGSIVLTKR